MYRYFSTFFLIVVMLFSGVILIQAQDRKNVIPRKGSNEMILQYNKKMNSVKSTESVLKPFATQHLKLNSVQGLIDTFSYRKTYGGDWTNTGTGFGQNANDVMVQWYKAPADLTIKAVGIGTTNNDNGQPASVKLVKLVNYTAQDIIDHGSATASGDLLGYFPGDGDGYNNIAPYDFGDATGSATGDWVSAGSYPIPFEDLWSDIGFGLDITPTPYPYEDNKYDWVTMNDLGFEPQVLSGEIFGISVSNTGNSITDVQAFWAQYGTAGALMNPAVKFYEYERNAGAGDYGWWVRPVMLDFIAVVDITGDEAPQISGVTSLGTTLSTDPQHVEATITDRNPGGGNAGVQSASIQYSTDGQTTWQTAAMTAGADDLYSGDIPGQTPGTVIDYFVEATDVESNSNQSGIFNYRIYAPTAGVKTLLVFNGLPDAGYPSDYYFGSGDWPPSYTTLSFDHDVWAYGNLTDGLVNNYDNIIEIATNIGGASDVNSTVISTWLAGGANRNYMLAGDEWIGVQSGWTNGAHSAGDFLFDVLGINYEYNDINYAASGDQGLASFVFPQAGSALGGDLYDFYTQVSSDSSWADTMKYDPAYEISVSNWLDGVDFESDVEVDMKGMAIDGTIYNIGGHRTLPAGNKIAFFSFDPLSLDTHTDAGDHYFWYGFTLSAPQVKVLDWFGIINDVKPIDNQIPTSFNISQNYPNPFNPNTNINFSIPEQSKVVIKVYDILGSEVATLVNEVKNAGNYNVDFNASNLASGMYVYTINAGDFVTSKKMMLLK